MERCAACKRCRGCRRCKGRSCWRTRYIAKQKAKVDKIKDPKVKAWFKANCDRYYRLKFSTVAANMKKAGKSQAEIDAAGKKFLKLLQFRTIWYKLKYRSVTGDVVQKYHEHMVNQGKKDDSEPEDLPKDLPDDKKPKDGDSLPKKKDDEEPSLPPSLPEDKKKPAK